MSQAGIPTEILERAVRILGQCRLSSGATAESILAHGIHGAVIAEREACAKIVDDEVAAIQESPIGSDWIGGSVHSHNAVIRELRTVASRIRARGSK